MIELLPMTAADLSDAISLWRACDGIGLRDPDDRPDSLARYLDRNPGCSFAVRHEGVLIAAALAGHDGRRGFLHHVAVRSDYRNRGIGRKLVDHCLAALRAQGIIRCHIFVYRDNHEGRRFWELLQWKTRMDLEIMTIGLTAG